MLSQGWVSWGDSASQLPAGGGRQGCPPPSPDAENALSHGDTPQAHTPCKLFKLLLNTKTLVSTTERCIQRTLKKRVRHSNVQKSPVPPPACCPAPSPTVPGSPRGVGWCWGSQPHGGAQGSCPSLSCPQSPYPRLGRGKLEKGKTPKLPVGHPLLQGAMGQPLLHQPPPRRAEGVQISPMPQKSGKGG